MTRRKKTKEAAEDPHLDPPPAMTPEERHRWISEAAYYRAERRDFAEGDRDEDWLAAEKEVDRRLQAAPEGPVVDPPAEA